MQAQWTNTSYESIVHMLGVRTGLDFRPSQREGTEQGIDRAMAHSTARDMQQYAALLEYDDKTLDDLIVELTVGETYFFREPLQFEYIRRHILSEIRAEKGPEHDIRMWSAGCASGEEPYSLAILCDQEGLAPSCDILATDISSAAIAKARQATYGEWSLRDAGNAQAKDYLSSVDGEFHVQERIRNRVRFEFLNLALDVYPSWVTGTRARDLILCRNVLIYFDSGTVRAVATRLFDCLNEGGWLILASGDPPIDEYAAYETVVTDAGVFYRKPKSQAATCAAKRQESPVWQATTVRPEARPRTIADHVETGRSVSTSRVLAEPRLLARDVDSCPVALAALAEGEYELAVELTSGHLDKPDACILHIKAMANIDTIRAASLCGRLTQRHPLQAELHYLHGVLLMELHQDEEACQAVQHAIFLDRSLAIGHFLLGSILQRRGLLEGAQRSFRNAMDLCSNLPPDAMVALSDHETNGHLAQAAEMRLATIDSVLGRGA